MTGANALRSSGARIAIPAVGILVTVIGALGVHVGLQQTFGVPFPSAYPSRSALERIDQATAVFGILVLLAWSRASLGRLPVVARTLALFAVYAMLRESLRGAVMEGVVTTTYAYPLLALVPKLLGYLALALLCVVVQPRVPRRWQMVLAAAGIYACVAFVVQPALARLFAAPLARFASLEHDEVYKMPYGAHVLIPAYITYVEPALAAIACAALTWRRAATWRTALLRFVVLLLLLRRSLFPPFIYALARPHRALSSFASAGQFSLETIALAVLAFATWSFTVATYERESEAPA